MWLSFGDRLANLVHWKAIPEQWKVMRHRVLLTTNFFKYMMNQLTLVVLDIMYKPLYLQTETSKKPKAGKPKQVSLNMEDKYERFLLTASSPALIPTKGTSVLCLQTGMLTPSTRHGVLSRVREFSNVQCLAPFFCLRGDLN